MLSFIMKHIAICLSVFVAPGCFSTKRATYEEQQTSSPSASSSSIKLDSSKTIKKYECKSVFECQLWLVKKEYDIGPEGADGIYGSHTAAAWAKCRADKVCIGPLVPEPNYYPYVPPSLPPSFGHDNGNFIPYGGNGLGPTQCFDGKWSHSSGRGACSHHGGAF